VRTLMAWRSNAQRAYARELPGGGYAAIDVTRVTSIFRKARYEAALLIERRAKPRHDGDVPLVIATAAGESIDAVLRQLLPAAQCNWAIGAGLMRREAVLR
jgi:hypothetical protein